MVHFEEAVQKLDNYIWAMSHRFAFKLRGFDVSDLHQEGLIKLYEICTSASHGHKPELEIIKLFKTSLTHRFIDIQREQAIQDQHLVTVDLEVISQQSMYFP